MHKLPDDHSNKPGLRSSRERKRLSKDYDDPSNGVEENNRPTDNVPPLAQSVPHQTTSLTLHPTLSNARLREQYNAEQQENNGKRQQQQQQQQRQSQISRPANTSSSNRTRPKDYASNNQYVGLNALAAQIAHAASGPHAPPDPHSQSNPPASTDPHSSSKQDATVNALATRIAHASTDQHASNQDVKDKSPLSPDAFYRLIGKRPLPTLSSSLPPAHPAASSSTHSSSASHSDNLSLTPYRKQNNQQNQNQQLQQLRPYQQQSYHQDQQQQQQLQRHQSQQQPQHQQSQQHWYDHHQPQDLEASPNSFYHTVRLRHRRVNYHYQLYETLATTLLVLQLLLSATFIVLGSITTPHSHVTIAVLGAVATLVAGVLALMKGQGLPNRLRMERDALGKVLLAADELCADVSAGREVSFESIRVLRDMYARVLDDAARNHPDTWNSSMPGAAAGGATGAGKVGGQVGLLGKMGTGKATR